MAEMRISNTLWNDTSSGEIAYAEQLKDRQIDYSEFEKITAEVRKRFGLDNKFQAGLNRLFLNHYNEYQRFLHDAGAKEGVIDSWRELEEFLENISDSESVRFAHIIRDVQLKSGQLNIRMSEEYPGVLEAVTTQSIMTVDKSYIDPNTGKINIVFNFE